MSTEFAPGKPQVETVISGERAATYQTEVEADVHTDGDLLNQPPIATPRSLDASDHRMSKEDTPAPEVPPGFRD